MTNMPELLVEAGGATIVQDGSANYSAYTEFLANNGTNQTLVFNADFLVSLPEYLNQLTTNPNNITDLESLRAFTQSSPPEDYPDRDTDQWDDTLAQGWDNTDPRFWPVYQANLFFAGEGGLQGALQRASLDAVVLPTVVATDIPVLDGAPALMVPAGSFPMNQTVQTSQRGLVSMAPGMP